MVAGIVLGPVVGQLVGLVAGLDVGMLAGGPGGGGGAGVCLGSWASNNAVIAEKAVTAVRETRVGTIRFMEDLLNKRVAGWNKYSNERTG